jgi:hypothetical protein
VRFLDAVPEHGTPLEMTVGGMPVEGAVVPRDIEGRHRTHNQEASFRTFPFALHDQRVGITTTREAPKSSFSV